MKNCDREVLKNAAREGSIFKAKVTVFHDTDRPKAGKSLTIFFLLGKKKKKRKKKIQRLSCKKLKNLFAKPKKAQINFLQA